MESKKKCVKYCLSIVVGFFVVFSTDLFGEGKTDKNALNMIEDQLSLTIEYIFQEDYFSADSLCESIIEDYTDHPAGYFMKGILHWKKGYFLNNYNEYNEKTLKWLKKAEEMAKKKIKQNPNDAVAHFFAGGAYGYEGSVYARRKSWLKTGRSAYRGIRELDRSIKLDPSLYDTFYGSGLYHVLASHQPGVVKFLQKILPIPAGDAEKGLNHLQIAVEKGKFTNLAAKAALALAYIYYEEKYEEAINLLIPLIEQYPKNLDFLTNLINAYFYRELTTPSNNWETLSDVIDYTRKVVENQDIDFHQWWLKKMDFIDGYIAYMNGDFSLATTILNEYCETYPKKGGSYLSGLGYLTLGKIADLHGRREKAVNYYKKVKNFEQIGNEKELAKSFIQRPFQGEEKEIPFSGTYVDLPDRP